MVGIGAQPGGYELLAELGRGGMATLFLAKREGAAGFERLVAVKVVLPHLADDERFTLMFIDEAKLSSLIQHPNVVRVEDFGEHEGTYFMAMEYVHGCSLAELMAQLAHRRRRLAPALAAHIAMQVAAGLHAAHETTDAQDQPLELVHRDVSPQNVLLAYSGHVKLIDFGIAKARVRAQETKSVRIKGKLGYMAPEQVLQTPLDRRTDVYALGIVLWEMLTMRRYFQADNELAMLDMIRAPAPQPPSEHIDVDVGLERVVMSALAPDPRDRPESARELRKRLANVCPEALAVDATDFAELLASSMSGHRTKLAQKLPTQIVGVLESPSPTTARKATVEVHTEELDMQAVLWTEGELEVPVAAADGDATDVERLSRPDDGELLPLPRASFPDVQPPPLPRRPPLWFSAAVVGIALLVALTIVLAQLGPTDESSDVTPSSSADAGVAPATSAVVDPPTENLDPPARGATVAVEARSEHLERAAQCEAGDHRCVVDTLEEHAHLPRELTELFDAQEALGDVNAARRTAREYLARYPRGPDAVRLRRMVRR